MSRTEPDGEVQDGDRDRDAQQGLDQAIDEQRSRRAARGEVAEDED